MKKQKSSMKSLLEKGIKTIEPAKQKQLKGGGGIIIDDLIDL